nr:MAG TPA: central spike protein [Caudoviricetes sp.]
MSESVYSNLGLYTNNNFANAISFIIKSIVKNWVYTSIPVLVQEVYAGENGRAGFVKVLPLVMPRDSQNNSIQPASIPRIPFFRLYAGTCEIVCDPVPGDIGLAVFAKQDVSRVKSGTTSPQPAGSFRTFDMSDGFYIGGFLNGGGNTKIVFDQNGSISIIAPESVNVQCKTAVVKADESVSLQTPQTNMSGNLTVDGLITGKGGMTISGGNGATVQGDIAVTGGDVTADSISLKGHVHGGVESGGSNTSTPQ